MKIYNAKGQEIADVILTKSAEHEEEMMKSDFVKLSWNDSHGDILPVGAYIIPFPSDRGGDGEQYSLLEPYIPEQKSEVEWKYEPKFNHPKMYLSKVIFQRPSSDTGGNDVTYFEWPYTGSVVALLEDLTNRINDALGLTDEQDKIKCKLTNFTDKVISVQFNSVDILSALTNIANTCKCEWHIDWKTKTLFFGHIKIDLMDGTPELRVGVNVGVPTIKNSKEGYWNAFEPQGSVRNIMRRSQSAEFVQSDVRLSLKPKRGESYAYPIGDTTVYPNGIELPDGIVYTDGKGHIISKEDFLENGEKLFLKPLIFEDVYPRQDLYIYKLRYREMYMLDSNKKRIVTHTDEDGVQHYLKYAIWYFRLARPILNAQGEATDWIDMDFTEEVVVPYANQAYYEDRHADMDITDTNYVDGMFTTKKEGQYLLSFKRNASLTEAEVVAHIRQQVDRSHDYVDQEGHHHTLNDRLVDWDLDITVDDEQESPERVEVNFPTAYTNQQRQYRIYISGTYTVDEEYWDDSEMDAGGSGSIQTETVTYNINEQQICNYTPIIGDIYDVAISKNEIPIRAEMVVNITENKLAKVNTSAFSDADIFEQFKTALNKGGRIQIVEGADGTKFDKDNKVSTIIYGKKPVIAFQPNTYRDGDRYAEPTPLAGLGNGDGEGHYGFVVRYMKMQGQLYIDSVNRRQDTEHVGVTNSAQGQTVQEGETGDVATLTDGESNTDKIYDGEGDTGVLDWITGQPAVVDEHDYELEFEQNGTTVIPSTQDANHNGIIPRADHLHNDRPTLFGNKVNMYNIVVGADAERAAQVELAVKTEKYINEEWKDKNSYTVKSNPVVFDIDNPRLYIGRKVMLNTSDGLNLETRVMKLVTKLDHDFEQEITVGNEVIKGSREEVKQKVDAIIAGNMSIGSGGGMSESYVRALIQNWTTPRFLSKIVEDTAQELTGFAKGLWVKAKGLFGIDENGNANVNRLSASGDATLAGKLSVASETTITGILKAFGDILTNSLQSRNFTGGDMTGTGWQLTNDNGEGNSSLIIDYLTVRMRAIFAELEIRKMIHTAGNYIFSPAGSQIERVECLDAQGNIITDESEFANASIFRCWLTADDGTTTTVNTWHAGMLARCETFDISQTHRVGTNGTTGNIFYWRLVKATGELQDVDDDSKKHHYVDLSNQSGEYAQASMVPNAGDSIVCYGANTMDGLYPDAANYAHLVTIETVGSDAPAFKEFRGVGMYNGNRTGINWSLTGKRKTMISPKSGNEFYAPKFVIETSSGTEELYNEKIKGRCIGFEPSSTDQIWGRAELNEILLINYYQPQYKIRKRTDYNDYRDWDSQTANLGDGYVSNDDGHLYVAVSSGWMDRGVYDPTKVLATFRQVIDEDVETSIATSMGVLASATGLGTVDEGQIIWLNVGEYVRSSTESLTRLKSTVYDGKNMLRGALTGSGWKAFSGGGDVPATLLDVGDITTGNMPMMTPIFSLVQGKKYIFSYYATQELSSIGLSLTQSSSPSYITGAQVECGTESGRTRYALRFTAQNTGTYCLFLYYDSGSTTVWHPMLEEYVGDGFDTALPTEFEASESEQEALMRITSGAIEMKVEGKIPSVNLMSMLNWTDNSGNVLTPDVQLEKVGNANKFYSPQIYLEAGTYTFSAFIGSLYARVETRPSADGQVTTLPTTASPDHYTLTAGTETYQSLTRRYFTFTLDANKYVRIYLYLPAQGTVGIYRPQLEKGDKMNGYVAIGDSVGSTGYATIKANAVNIGIRQGLENTGIDIEHGNIVLNAAKTTINGDLNYKGLLTESTTLIETDTAAYVQPDSYDGLSHMNIRIDMSTLKSLVVRPRKGTDGGYIGGTATVILPKYEQYSISGTHLVIRNPYNPFVANWNYMNQIDKSALGKWGVVICSDDRAFDGDLMYEKSYNPIKTDDTYDNLKGCMVLNGMMGRFLLLMPGQSIELVSSVEYYKGSKLQPYLAWYIVGGANLVPMLSTIEVDATDGEGNYMPQYNLSTVRPETLYNDGDHNTYAFFGPECMSDTTWSLVADEDQETRYITTAKQSDYDT